MILIRTVLCLQGLNGSGRLNFQRKTSRMTTIKINISNDSEASSFPWWAILDPHQFFRANKDGLDDLASMITGPFFSREEANAELNSRRYDYGKHATVYCFSGYHSGQYKRKIREQRKGGGNP